MRGCLKSHPPTPTSTPNGDGPARKCVAFELEAALETVFVADEWDRTPMEPSRKLSYQDLLELKEIQRSLPRANQPPDVLAGRAGKHYLAGVPIGLLPLLPESDSSPKTTSPTSPTSTSPSWMSLNPPPPPARYNPVFQPPPSSNLHPSNLPPRQKPRFAFLPLLDAPGTPEPAPSTLSTAVHRSRTPSPARSDPPTPALTNASLESSPMSQTSVCSTEPSFFQLPPRRDFYMDDDEDDGEDSFPRSLSSAMRSMSTKDSARQRQPSPRRPSPTRYDPAALETSKPHWFGRSNPAFKPAYPPSTPTHTSAPVPTSPQPKPKRQRNVIVVNGIEIDLDGSDDEDDEPTKPTSPPPPSSTSQIKQPQPISLMGSPTRSGSGASSPSSITSNGLPTPPPSTSPSPTLQSRAPLPPVDDHGSRFSGLHAPVVFKRRVPAPTSPPNQGAQRRGSLCGQQQYQQEARASPGLVPRT